MEYRSERELLENIGLNELSWNYVALGYVRLGTRDDFSLPFFFSLVFGERGFEKEEEEGRFFQDARSC